MLVFRFTTLQHIIYNRRSSFNLIFTITKPGDRRPNSPPQPNIPLSAHLSLPRLTHAQLKPTDSFALSLSLSLSSLSSLEYLSGDVMMVD